MGSINERYFTPGAPAPIVYSLDHGLAYIEGAIA